MEGARRDSLTAMTRAVGLIANPASGKDIRRMFTYASVITNEAKKDIICRVLAGLAAMGVTDVYAMDDPKSLALAAASVVPHAPTIHLLPFAGRGDATVTTRAAAALRELDVAAVITLGGDGTNRAAAKGWLDIPVIALSTGTNNAFPRHIDGTVAGMAAGVVASGAVSIHDVAHRSAVVHIEIVFPRAEICRDLALIDAVVLEPGFVGARALSDPSQLRAAVCSRSDPASVGICSIAGIASTRMGAGSAYSGPVSLTFDHNAARLLTVAFAPGVIVPIGVSQATPLAFGDVVRHDGPALLAFDGERELSVDESCHINMWVEANGPMVIDVAATLRLANSQ